MSPVKSGPPVLWFIILIPSNRFAQYLFGSIIALNSVLQEHRLRTYVYESMQYASRVNCSMSVVQRDNVSLRRLAGDAISADQTFRNTKIISARLQRAKLCQSGDVRPLLCEHQTNGLRWIYVAIKKGFGAERKWPHICAQSSLWRVMRITGPLFSSRREKEPGRGAEAQVSLRRPRS